MTTYRVLSLKQPWATLLSAGLKTVEIRRWKTRYRGLLLIHAARVPDPREQAWDLVPPHLKDRAAEAGGVVGAGTLASIKAYRSAAAFADDHPLHLNDPSWFEPAGLFGFSFRDLRPVPFCRLPGQVRLFRREMADFFLPPPPPPPAPLASESGGGPGQRLGRLIRSFLGRRPCPDPERR